MAGRGPPLCCVGPTCGCIDTNLVLVRAVLVPIGVLFVALCPTVNFWSDGLGECSAVRPTLCLYV
jgi:hypothetical protein